MKYFFLTIAVVMSCIFVFNAKLDVAGFRTGEVLPLAKRQAANEALVSDRDYDQRSWVRARLAAHCPKTLILGSSTVGTLASDMIGGDVVNAWLTGPAVEDFEAVAQMLRVHNCRPERVIVGIDPFLVNPKVSSNRWRTVKELQRAFASEGGGQSEGAAQDDGPATANAMTQGWAQAKGGWLRFTDRLAFQTTRDGVRLLAKGESEARGPQLLSDLTTYCAATSHPQSVRHRDGHFSYCDRWLKPVDAVEEIARTYVKRDVHKTRSWSRLSMARMDRISGVVAMLRRRGAQVALVTPTVHPLTLAAMHSDAHITALLAELDANLRKIAKASGASFIGIRNPASVSCKTSEFFDSHHPAPSCATRIAAHVRTSLQGVKTPL